MPDLYLRSQTDKGEASATDLRLRSQADKEPVGGFVGVLKRWTGSAWVKAKLMVYSGGSWQQKTLRVRTGSGWGDVDTGGV